MKRNSVAAVVPMIFVVRPGETTWSREGRQQGHLDSPLTSKGVAQARAAGQALKKLVPEGRKVCIETSPIGRARQTAALLCAELGLDVNALVVSPLLVEHHLGSWQGLTNTQIDERYPGARRAREENKWTYTVPGGESYALVHRRAQQWLAQERRAPVTVAVTHEMYSRALQGAYGGLTPAETLGRSHHQGRIYWLHDSQIEEIHC
jgi:probable phosphoglycerate mutase